ncbi:MAG: VWA domain-containing protein [Planctomycetota bacterium]|nr:VWA domain-containing protein [Planctomycetota bacterium]
MRIRYLDWKEGVQRLLERMKLFRKLFSYFLVREDGDVERALEILRLIGEKHGLFDENFTFEDLKRQLVKERLVAQTPSGFSLTPRGERFVRTETLNQVFSNLKPGTGGDHRTPYAGRGLERLAETRPYNFGDDVADIDFNRSFQNAFRREARENWTLRESDLEVYETERYVSVATCLLVDVSHSMILYGEDRITPAKRVALALTELILSRYPKDAFHVILFGDVATEVSVRDLTYCGVGPYHTNTHAALRLARQILMRKKHSNKQIFMITDGKPTALFEDGGLYINSFGLDRKIVNKTLDEAAECRRHNIPITTFMLAREPHLVQFVNRLTRVNNGRAYFSSLDRLEQTVFVDYLTNRRRKVR